MKSVIQFASILSHERSLLLFSLLMENGFPLVEVNDSIDPNELVICCFDETATSESFLSLPWLKEQEEYSSYPYLRVLPFFVYSSSKGDVEELFEEGLGDEIEEVFSGEFKPFGFDFDDIEGSVKELKRVIEESYSE